MKDLSDAANKLTVREFQAGDAIVKKGDRRGSFFIVDRGRCIVLVNGQQVAEMSEGESFGDKSLLRDTARAAATIEAASSVKCLMLTRQIFTELIKERENRESMIRGAKLFETFTDDQVARLAGALERQWYGPKYQTDGQADRQCRIQAHVHGISLQNLYRHVTGHSRTIL
jgi:CRP-like cAMP-binding protein